MSLGLKDATYLLAFVFNECSGIWYSFDLFNPNNPILISACSGNKRVKIRICGSSTDGVNADVVGQDGGVDECEEGGLGGGAGGSELSSGIGLGCGGTW